MISLEVNFWPILAGGVAAMILGSLWYSPLLFGKPWMKAMGITHADMEAGKKKGMALSYLSMFATELVKAFIVAHFVDYVGAIEWFEGVELGFWLWLGFIATTSLSGYIWTVKPKPKILWTIENGYMLSILIIQAVILTLWI